MAPGGRRVCAAVSAQNCTAVPDWAKELPQVVTVTWVQLASVGYILTYMLTGVFPLRPLFSLANIVLLRDPWKTFSGRGFDEMFDCCRSNDGLVLWREVYTRFWGSCLWVMTMCSKLAFSYYFEIRPQVRGHPTNTHWAVARHNGPHHLGL